MPDLCVHGDFTACCMECLETSPAPVRREREEPDSPPVAATFLGLCTVCDGDIDRGTLIVHTTEDRWVHTTCVGRL